MAVSKALASQSHRKLAALWQMAQSGSILISGVRDALRDFDLRGLSSLEYILAAMKGDDK